MNMFMMKISHQFLARSGNFYFLEDPGLNPRHLFDSFIRGFESSSNHSRLNKLPPPARPFALAGGQFVGRGYLVMAIYPLTMAGLVPLPKRFSHVNQSTYVFGRGYLVMAIYPLTMAGLVPLPKQFLGNIFSLSNPTVVAKLFSLIHFKIAT